VSTAESLLPRRERARAATIEEIKQTALHLMREQGTTDVRFADIARAMGMTAPALYRYFHDRDELLTSLIVDGYDDLGTAVARARDALPADDIPGRFLAIAQAYRAWAKIEPQRFALIFGLPVPGYVAPDEGPTTEAAERAMGQLKSIFFEAAERGLLGEPMLHHVGPALSSCTQDAPQSRPDEEHPLVPPATFQAMLHIWTGLHGFVCLEAYGHFDWIGPEAADELFLSQVRLAAKVGGLPVPVGDSAS
jgi:AcrR family transcriptional regulator